MEFNHSRVKKVEVYQMKDAQNYNEEVDKLKLSSYH